MKHLNMLLTAALLLLAVGAGSVSADPASETTTPTATTAVTGNTTLAEATAEPGTTGGSVYFETHPAGAAIWVDGENLGTSPFTHYFEKTGTINVTARKKGFADYTGTVTAGPGKRAVFSVDLTSNIVDVLAQKTAVAAPVTTVTTLKRSTLAIPTSWPTTPQESPVETPVVIGALFAAAGFLAIRHRR